MNKQMWIVVLENDGAKPSSSYYEKRQKLALRVRTNDLDLSATPLTRRRLGENLGAIIQEGAIVTSSYSQAKLVAELARQYGVEVIFFGSCDLQPYEASPPDRAAWEKVEKVLSRKGRKPDPQTWTVTCLEELLAFEVEASEVYLCPSCQGVAIQVRLGPARRLRAITPHDDPLAYWLHSRFQTGTFELPAEGGQEIATSVSVQEERELVQDLLTGEVGALAASGLPLTPKFRLDLLDAAYVCRTSWPREARDAARARALIAWVREYKGEVTQINLVEPPKPDLIDCAGILGENLILPVLKAWQCRTVVMKYEKNNE